MWAKGLKRCSNTKFITPFDGGRIEETKIFRTDRHRDDFLDKPKRCKKAIKNITPTLPSPLRGGGLGWGGQKAPEVKSCDHRKNRYGPLNIEATTNFAKFFLQLLSKDKSGSFDYFFKPIVQQREEEKTKPGSEIIKKGSMTCDGRQAVRCGSLCPTFSLSPPAARRRRRRGYLFPKGSRIIWGAFCRDKGAGELFSDWPSAKILGHEKKPAFLVVRLKSK